MDGRGNEDPLHDQSFMLGEISQNLKNVNNRLEKLETQNETIIGMFSKVHEICGVRGEIIKTIRKDLKDVKERDIKDISNRMKSEIHSSFIFSIISVLIEAVRTLRTYIP